MARAKKFEKQVKKTVEAGEFALLQDTLPVTNATLSYEKSEGNINLVLKMTVKPYLVGVAGSDTPIELPCAVFKFANTPTIKNIKSVTVFVGEQEQMWIAIGASSSFKEEQEIEVETDGEKGEHGS